MKQREIAFAITPFNRNTGVAAPAMIIYAASYQAAKTQACQRFPECWGVI